MADGPDPRHRPQALETLPQSIDKAADRCAAIPGDEATDALDVALRCAVAAKAARSS